MTATIKACPICGTEVRDHCWHPNTEEVDSEEMEISKAVQLVQARIDELLSELSDAREQMAEYQERCK